MYTTETLKVVNESSLTRKFGLIQSTAIVNYKKLVHEGPTETLEFRS